MEEKELQENGSVTAGREESMADFAGELEASLRQIREGDILSGTVIDVKEEEVTLDLKSYAPGIIKAEDMSGDPGFCLTEEVKEGDVLEATVISLDDGAGNICLSRKEAAAVQAWELLHRYLQEETIVTVRVSEIVKGGAVAYLEGIRGFLPASQLSLSYVEDLTPFQGRELRVRVTEIDETKGRLILSAKVVAKEEAQEEQSHKIAMLAPGAILEGKVESLMPYGAFISLPDGLSGLVHISQICGRRIRKPSEVLTVGETVKVKVLGTRDNKISLSIKAAQEDGPAEEWEGKEAASYSDKEAVTTTLGDLLKGLNL